ncbi:hypothetical protein WJX82_007700 [Trebouxia sp. C0006]
MDDKALFNLFCCPLTKVAMHDPLIAADGHTYERRAMEHWLRQHGTSPITAEPSQAAVATHAMLSCNLRLMAKSMQ